MWNGAEIRTLEMGRNALGAVLFITMISVVIVPGWDIEGCELVSTL